jgi:hypothetical protein
MIRGAYALCAASFLFFLLYSAPHRVHHFFEQFKAANHDAHDHHSQSERRDPPSNDSNCVFQVSANSCALGLTALIQPLTLTQFVQRLFISQETTHLPQFLFAAFQIRAPPKA